MMNVNKSDSSFAFYSSQCTTCSIFIARFICGMQSLFGCVLVYLLIRNDGQLLHRFLYHYYTGFYTMSNYYTFPIINYAGFRMNALDLSLNYSGKSCVLSNHFDI